MSDFAYRLAEARKERGMTQQALADEIGVHVSQQRRYEAGDNQPTLDILASSAIVLGVTLDWLVYGANAPPVADNLRHAVRVLQRLTDDEQAIAITVIDALHQRHNTHRRVRRR